MDQSKALMALEPFLALTKSASSPRAAADLITRATSHPHTFVFTELLVTPPIQALREADGHAGFLRLLEIFSYGLYADYTSTPGLPELNAAQLLKLKQLTLVSLARDPANLTYAALQSALDLPTTRALEDLVITAIYAGLLTATLDPHHGRVAVAAVAPLRDLAPSSVPAMLAGLRAWSARCAATLAALEADLEDTRRAAAQRHGETRAWDDWFEQCAAEEKNAGATGAAAKAGAGPGKRNMDGMLMGYKTDGSMDVDDDVTRERQRRGGKIPKKKGSVVS